MSSKKELKNVFGLVWCKIQALFFIFSLGLDAVYNKQELFCPISFIFWYFCDDDIGMQYGWMRKQKAAFIIIERFRVVAELLFYARKKTNLHQLIMFKR